MNVLSLFDGMSCGQLALQRLDIKVDAYYASEIDKYAMQVTQANFPNTIHIGDVCDIKAEDYQDIDLILAGSPCQGFSFAGKQLAFDDPRSALFFEFIRLLKAIKPKYFLLENVRMKQQYLDVITQQVSECYPEHEGNDLFDSKIEPILINSALLSAQSRQRLYWTNIPNVKQPADRGMVLKDILEDDFNSERDKSYCIDANYYKGANVEQYKKKSRRQLVSKPKQVENREPKIVVKDLVEEERIVVDKEKRQLLIAEATKKGYTVIEDGDCFDISYPNSKTRRGRNMKYKCNALTAVNQNYMRFENLSWRKLTPLECERLQTVPDNYTASVSNTQRYKMLGNGWTVDVICHILKQMD